MNIAFKNYYYGIYPVLWYACKRSPRQLAKLLAWAVVVAVIVGVQIRVAMPPLHILYPKIKSCAIYLNAFYLQAAQP